MTSFNWNGGDGAFSDGGNWTDDGTGQTGTVPGAGDSIESLLPGSITFSGNTVAGAGFNGPFTLDLSGGGLTVTGWFSDGSGTGPITLQGGGTLSIGWNYSGSNPLVVTDGATYLDTFAANMGQPDFWTSLTVEDGGTVNTQAGGLDIQGTDAVLTVTDGTVLGASVTATGLSLSAGLIDVSEGFSADGPISISGGTIEGGDVDLEGAVTIAGGTIATSGTASTVDFGDFDASSVGSVANLSLTGGSLDVGGQSWSFTAVTMTVTGIAFGPGVTANVGSGSQLTSGGGLLEGGASLTLSGAGTGWTLQRVSSGPIFVVVGGTLTIQQGATVAVDPGAGNDGTEIDSDEATPGSVVVTGDGSSLSDTGNVVIGRTGAASLTIESGGTLDVGGNIDIGELAGSTGTVTFDGADTDVSVGGTLTIGDAGLGTLNVNNGATLDAPPDLVFGAQAAPAGGTTDPVTGVHTTNVDTLNVTGGIIEAGSITVGQAGYGAILFAGGSTDGTVDAADTVTVAEQAGSEGQIIVDGTNSALNTGDFTVGSSGNALVTVGSDNSITTDGDAVLAENSGSQATVVLGDDSLMGQGGAGNADWSISGNLTVGDAGKATLQSNTSSLEVDGSTLTIGDQKGSNGLLTMSASQLSFDGTLTIGDQGTGELLFQLGSTSTAGTDEKTPSITLGQQQGGSGTLIVTGAGTEMQASALEVGAFGKGNAQITSGATLQVIGDVDVASDAEGVIDSMTVSGTSYLGIAGALSVGSFGVATLQVQTEAQVAAVGGITIGENQGASAVVTVNGTSTDPGTGTVSVSSIGYGATLTVGEIGIGTLLIQQGALVAPLQGGAGAIEMGATAGGSGTITVQGAGSMLQGSTLDIGGTFSAAGGSGTLTIMTGATVDVSDVTVWSGGKVKLSGGRLQTDPIAINGGDVAGYGAVNGVITNDGTITTTGGTLDLTGDVSGTGDLLIGDGGTLQLDGVASGVGVNFVAGGTNEVLLITAPSDLQATIAGFVAGDAIEASALLGATYSYSSDGTETTLTFTNGQTDLGNLVFDGVYSQSQLAFDATTGSVTTTAEVPCYAAGTMILTTNGEVAVENLAAGDLVVTVSGEDQPIRWIGHRQVDCRRHPRSGAILPVRIEAHAFGSDRPSRDLFLSPDHAVFIEDVLIPVKHLQNGTTVRQIEVDSVTYYHIELEQHDVVLADGLAVETFLDTGNRGAFANGGGTAQSHPDFGPPVDYNYLMWETFGYAPLVVAGEEIARAGSGSGCRVPTAHAAPGTGSLVRVSHPPV